ncbi:SET domain-containing protein [Stipitochalara longipes BDJ]|nr:SET domain-containing protein [Stipitochalara longipes BDJ]
MASTKGALAPGSAFPFNVNSRVPLEIITSTIPNAGRGLALLGEIKKGELIFSISKPLLCIVGDGIEKVTSTCNNCFASNTYFHVNPHDQESSLGEEIQECQETAWNHHHNAECAVLAELHSRFVRTESGPSLAWGLTYRAVIRFLSLLSKNMISKEDHEAYKALCPTGNIVEDEGEQLDERMKSLVAVLEAALKIKVSAFEMMVFIDKFKANRVNLSTPILKNDRTNLPSQHNFSNTGYCLEPFVALISHSCEPNAHYVFEGTELRVRASRDISKGEEVTFSYLGQVGDYEGRRQLLQRLWGIRCTCSICTECLWNDDYGFVRAHEALGAVRTAIPEVYNSCPPPSPASLVSATDMLERAGLGYGVPSMLEAHQLLILLHTNSGNVEEALKTALKTRFLIEPQQRPKMQLKDRLSTLFNIILLLQSPKQPEEVFSIGRLVVGDLRRMYLRDIRICFGDDSMVYRHENSSLDKHSREMVDAVRKPMKPFADENGGHMILVRTDEKRIWLENMNKLLAWAGLQPLAEKQY